MEIMNCYGGLGGNRRKWGNQHNITTIEYDENIAKVYADEYPQDTLIIGDAHEYLRKNFKNFDFIWTSPPCQSHSSFRQNICVRYRGTEPIYPDMKLYEEILFLKYNFNGKWVVENVKPYYPALIEPDKILQRHYIWTNLDITDREFPKDMIRKAQIPDLEKKYGYDLSGYKLKNKRQVLRNCVHPDLGLHILEHL